MIQLLAVLIAVIAFSLFVVNPSLMDMEVVGGRLIFSRCAYACAVLVGTGGVVTNSLFFPFCLCDFFLSFWVVGFSISQLLFSDSLSAMRPRQMMMA